MRRFRALAGAVKLRIQVRCFATAGPSSDHVRAVPFTRSVAEARSAYDAYHQSWVSYLPSLSGVKERFVPFWAVSAVADVQISRARIGFNRIKTRYNVNRRQFETYIETEWETVHWSRLERPRWERRHDANTDERLQIYGSYDYRRAYVNGLRGEGCFTGATRLTASMVEQADGGVRGLEEFRMRPSVALDLARETIYKYALADAENTVRKMFTADRVEGVKLEVAYSNVLVSPVYVPAFVFTSRYFGEKMRTFIHGSTLSVGGQRLYHAPLAALAGGAAAAAYVGGVTGSVSLATIILPATVLGVVTLLYPLLVTRFREWWRVREEKVHQTRSFFGSWGEDYVNAYGMWEEYARTEESRRRRFYEEQQRTYERMGQEYQRQYSYKAQAEQEEPGDWYRRREGDRSSSRGYYNVPDPKGYYATLGLSPGAGEAEVKAAFKALALKHHPDRYRDPKEIEEAKKRFQKLSAAYQVLRDPGKKKVYDQTGRD